MPKPAMLPRNETGIATALGILAQRFRGSGSAPAPTSAASMVTRRPWLENQPPDAVVFPESTGGGRRDRPGLCRAPRARSIAFGTGTSLEGHLNAPAGGVSIDLSRMNAVLKVHPQDLDCVVQPRGHPASGSTNISATRAFSFRSIPAPTRASAAWPPPGPRARTRCATARCATTSSPSRRCLPTARFIRTGGGAGGPRAEILRRIRPRAPSRRLRRHARHHHRAYPAPARHSRGGLRRALLLFPRPKPLLRSGDPHDPDGPSRRPDRASRRRFAVGANQPPTRSSTCPRRRFFCWNSTAPRRGWPNRRRCFRPSPKRPGRQGANGPPTPKSGAASGAPVTMPIGRSRPCARGPTRFSTDCLRADLPARRNGPRHQRESPRDAHHRPDPRPCGRRQFPRHLPSRPRRPFRSVPGRGDDRLDERNRDRHGGHRDRRTRHRPGQGGLSSPRTRRGHRCHGARSRQHSTLTAS